MYEGQMISSGLNNSGDVVLAPEKKSRKKWIIIGVIVLVFIVVFAVMFMIPKSGIGGGGNANSTFNRFANYLLYGEDSTEALQGEYSEGEMTINEMVNDDSDRSEVFSEEVNTLWGDYVKNSSNTTFADGLTRDDYGKRVGFIVAYLNSGLTAEGQDLLSFAQSATSEEYDEYLNDYFRPFEEYDFSESNEYVSNGRSLFKGIYNSVNRLKDENCGVDTSEENIACDLIYDEVGDELDSYSSSMSNAVDEIVFYLIKNAWAISSQLNGETQ